MRLEASQLLVVWGGSLKPLLVRVVDPDPFWSSQKNGTALGGTRRWSVFSLELYMKSCAS